MVREIAGRLLSDELLQDYSYCGRRTKKKLQVYSNVIKLIIDATSLKFPKIRRAKILNYFKKEYVKHAKLRLDRQL